MVTGVVSVAMEVVVVELSGSSVVNAVVVGGASVVLEPKVVVDLGRSLVLNKERVVVASDAVVVEEAPIVATRVVVVSGA